LLRPSTTVILIYYQNYVACLSPLKHQELVLTFNEQARKKIWPKHADYDETLRTNSITQGPPSSHQAVPLYPLKIKRKFQSQASP